MTATDHPASPASPSTPLYSVTGPVATITLNRPAHRNRLEDEDLHTLLRLFAEVDANHDIRVLQLTANTQGQPRPVFCAGYHLGGFDDANHDPLLFERIPDTLARLRPVTVCALNGSVHGGATDLVLACDLRMGLAGTEFRMPATALGLHYYPTGLQRFVGRLGIAGAKRAFLTARPFSADHLLRIGCLEAVSPAETFEADVAQLVAEVAGLAPLAAQEVKRSLNEIAAGLMDLPALHARQALTAQSQDFAEGRRAFAEKRKPVFTGR